MKFFNRVRQGTTTLGQGTVTLGAVIRNDFLTAAEAGAVDGDVVAYCLTEGVDFEIGTGTLGGSATTLTRTVINSKILGVAGTAKMELSGSAQVVFIEDAATLNAILVAAGYMHSLPETIYTNDQTITLAQAGNVLTANKVTAITFGLPALASTTNEAFFFRNIGAGTLTLDPNASETIESVANVAISAGMTAMVWPNNGKTTWRAAVMQPPLSTTDNTLIRADGPAGKLQGSGIVVDDSNNVSGIGTLTTTGAFSTNGQVMSHTFVDPGATGPTLNTIHDSASPVLNDGIYHHLIYGRNSAAALINYGWLRWLIVDPTAGSEDVALHISNMVNGSLVTNFSLTATGAQFPAIGETTRGTGKFTTLGATAVQEGVTTLATSQPGSSTTRSFTGIPSWVKKITITLEGFSSNGTSPYSLQLGDSGGIEITGYKGGYYDSTGNAGAVSTSFIIFNAPTAGDVISGSATLTMHDTSNTWVLSSMFASNNGEVSFCAGAKALSAALDRVQLSTTSGTDTFDAGSINISYSS